MNKLWARLRSRAQPKPVAPAEVTERANYLELHPDVVHADPAQMDLETRTMYRDAREAAIDAITEREHDRTKPFVVRSPFKLGFVTTLGVLIALLVGGMIAQLSTVIMYVVGALFIALGLDPVVRWLDRRGVKRPIGIAAVFLGFIVIVAGALALIIPMIGNQIGLLMRRAPGLVRQVQSQEWFDDMQARFGGFVDLEELLRAGQDIVGNPDNWAQVAGGVWQAGVGIATGATATLIILVLTLYFLSSLSTIKRGFYLLVPRSTRAKVMDITEQVTESIGGYVSGMVILALINSVLGFIMMSIVEVPFAGLIAVFVFLLALIPLIGSVAATVLVTVVALFESPTAAIIAGVYYLVYMQIEAYLLTPRVMNRVVSVPGSLVVIGALTGGTLLGLLGALIAIPVTAMVLMIIKQVWIPKQRVS